MSTRIKTELKYGVRRNSDNTMFQGFVKRSPKAVELTSVWGRDAHAAARWVTMELRKFGLDIIAWSDETEVRMTKESVAKKMESRRVLRDMATAYKAKNPGEDTIELTYKGKKIRVNWTANEKQIFAHLWGKHHQLAEHVLSAPKAKHGEMLREYLNTGDIDSILAQRHGAVPAYVRDGSGKIVGSASTERINAIFPRGMHENPGESLRTKSDHELSETLRTLKGKARDEILKELGRRTAEEFRKNLSEAGNRNRKSTSPWEKFNGKPSKNPSASTISKKVEEFRQHCIAQGDSYAEATKQAEAYRRDIQSGAHKVRKNPHSRASSALAKTFWWVIYGNRIEKWASYESFPSFDKAVEFYTRNATVKETNEKRGGFILTSKKKMNRTDFITGFKKAYPDIKVSL